MSLLGGILSIGAGFLTRHLDNKRADSAAAAQRQTTVEDRENTFSDLRSAAIKGGFNPLTALQLTGGAGFGSGSSASGVSGAPPSLASVSAITEGFQSVGDILTSNKAVAEHKERIKNDLAQAEIANLQADLVGVGPSPLQLGGNVPTASVRRSQPALTTLSGEPRSGFVFGSRTPPANAAALADGEFHEGHVNIIEEVMTDSGEIVRVPVGPDIDEWVMGVGINAYGTARQYIRDTLAPAIGGFYRGTLFDRASVPALSRTNKPGPQTTDRRGRPIN
jgi:hypothetical protein